MIGGQLHYKHRITRVAKGPIISLDFLCFCMLRLRPGRLVCRAYLISITYQACLASIACHVWLVSVACQFCLASLLWQTCLVRVACQACLASPA